MGFLLCLLAWNMAHIQSEHDILFNRAPRQEQRLLEHIARLASPLCPGIAIDSNHSCARLINPCYDIEERTFSTPARTNHADEFAAGYGKIPHPSFDRRIYLASAQTLLEVVQDADDEAGTVLLVGHNPGLEDLVFLLVPEGADEAREQVEEKYPTASIAEITLPVDHWADAEIGSGTLDRFTRPRDLDPAFGPDATG